MKINSRKFKTIDKAISKLNPDELNYMVKSIQATEGGKDLVNLENLLFTFTTSSIDGLINTYKSYQSQVVATYLKYNNMMDYGNWQTKAIIDLRLAFIAGEGISVAATNPKTQDWLEKLMEKNKFNGSFFFRAAKGGEMTGKSLLFTKYDKEWQFPKLFRVPFGGITNDDGTSIQGINYSIVSKDMFDIFSEKRIFVNKGNTTEPMHLNNFVYVILGGDDISMNETNTKVGSVLIEIENYDRALKEMRRRNYVANRITPTFKAKDRKEASITQAAIAAANWKVGNALVTTADFDYKSPSTEANDNTEKELQSNVKAISTMTGVPVHWCGHTELMSNRATATSLYETIDNGTKVERATWAESIFDLFVKAQEVDIDSGMSELSEIDRDFTVQLPLISFEKFQEKIQALSLAYSDEAISIDDYRNFVPGINPLKTAKAIEAQKKKEMKEFKSLSDNISNAPLDDNGDKNKNNGVLDNE